MPAAAHRALNNAFRCSRRFADYPPPADDALRDVYEFLGVIGGSYGHAAVAARDGRRASRVLAAVILSGMIQIVRRRGGAADRAALLELRRQQRAVFAGDPDLWE